MLSLKFPRQKIVKGDFLNRNGDFRAYIHQERLQMCTSRADRYSAHQTHTLTTALLSVLYVVHTHARTYMHFIVFIKDSYCSNLIVINNASIFLCVIMCARVCPVPSRPIPWMHMHMHMHVHLRVRVCECVFGLVCGSRREGLRPDKN